MRIGSALLGGTAVLVGLTVLLGSWYTVDQSERAIVLNNGAVSGDAGPGLHFKMPIVQSVHTISLRTQTVRFENGTNDSRMEAYSKDQQPAHISVAVNYHITDPVQVYTQYHDVDSLEHNVINTRAYEQVKNVFGQFTAAEAIQNRSVLNSEVMKAVWAADKNLPIVVEGVQIMDITFSDQYEKAVEERMTATVKQQQATAEAAATRTRADANAYQKVAAGEAEAKAIRARGDALKDNPGLPGLVTAEKWDGHLPTTMAPGNTVPFLNVGQNGK